MKDCLHTHWECSPSLSGYLPTRLLELDDSQSPCSRLEDTATVRLISSGQLLGQEEAKYVALSHCWGAPDKKPIMATTTNITELEKGINLSDLPPVFQDAIQLTHALGMKYVWIDSLCIIQDSRGDWEHQSSMMSDIYMNAVLTISATHAENTFVPLLNLYESIKERLVIERAVSPSGRIDQVSSEQLALWSVGKFISPMYRLPGSSEQPVFLRVRNNLAIRSPLYEMAKHLDEHTEQRGWTLQERLLSPRKIFIGSKRMLWECRSKRYLEGWLEEVEKMIPSDEISWNHLNCPLFDTTLLKPIQDQKRFYKWWYSTIQVYMRRRFTFESDMLPGIAGIAKHFSQITGDQYIAGLWYSDLFRGLTWRVDRATQSSDWQKRRHLDIVNGSLRVGGLLWPKSIAECFAPSWSWASLWGSSREHIRSQSFNGDAISHHDMTWETRSQFEKSSECRLSDELRPQLIDAQIQPLTDVAGMTGQLKQAYLDVEMACSEIFIEYNISEYQPTRLRMDRFRFSIPRIPKNLNQYIYACMDYPRWLDKRIDTAKSEGGACVLTCALVGYTTGLHCLLLYPDDAEGTKDNSSPRFRRCGVVNIEYKADDFLGCWQRKRLILM
jgi:Heterokaryon incompatibility protein (HET)